MSAGITPPYAFQSSHFGYDPLYAHLRWEHRRDHDWERNLRNAYRYRREHESARPAHTWTALRNIQPDSDRGRHARLATSYEQIARRKDGPRHFQAGVPPRNASNSRGGRARSATSSRAAAPLRRGPRRSRPAKATAGFSRTRVRRPESPIVARASGSVTPPPSRRTRKPDERIVPRAGRPSGRRLPAPPGVASGRIRAIPPATPPCPRVPSSSPDRGPGRQSSRNGRSNLRGWSAPVPQVPRHSTRPEPKPRPESRRPEPQPARPPQIAPRQVPRVQPTRPQSIPRSSPRPRPSREPGRGSASRSPGPSRGNPSRSSSGNSDSDSSRNDHNRGARHR